MKKNHSKDGASLFKERSFAAIRRKKVLERVLKFALVIIAILMAIAVLFAYTSCTSDTAAVAPKTKVSVHVNEFSFSYEGFPGGHTRAAESLEKVSQIKAIDLAIFSGDKKVFGTTQLRDDATTYEKFGEFECSLSAGDYKLVAVARNMSDGDKFTIQSPVLATYASERVRETFCYTKEISIKGVEPVDITPIMDRVVAQFMLTTTDKMMEGVNKIRTTYSAGSKSFNPTTGLATDDNGFWLTNSGRPQKDSGVMIIYSLLFLAADEEVMDVTIDVLDKDENVLINKRLPNVHFKRNQITKATGALFTPGTSSFTFLLNDAWLPDEEITF